MTTHPPRGDRMGDETKNHTIKYIPRDLWNAVKDRARAEDSSSPGLRLRATLIRLLRLYAAHGIETVEQRVTQPWSATPPAPTDPAPTAAPRSDPE